MQLHRFFLLVALCSCIVGCPAWEQFLLKHTAPDIELSSSDAEMSQRILEVVPVGTTIAEATERMEKHGYKVYGVEEWDSPAYKGKALRCGRIYPRGTLDTKIYVFFSFDDAGITGATVHRSFIRRG